jgi:rod shape-determining protein MreD
MLSLFWQKLDQGARILVPASSAFMFALLGAGAWPLPYFGAVAPPLALIAVYYWAIHRPDLFGPGTAFLVGLLNDALHFLPPGLSALLFVGAHQFVFSHRRFFAGHSFYMMWSGFALTAVAAGFGEWVLLAVLHEQWIPLLPVFLEAVLAIVLFPLPCWLLIRLQRAALSQG